MERVSLRISGSVQGVFYRFFVQKLAHELDVVGWAQNNSDGSVAVVAEGPRVALEQLVDQCRQGSDMASVDDIVVEWSDTVEGFSDFEIK